MDTLYLMTCTQFLYLLPALHSGGNG